MACSSCQKRGRAIGASIEALRNGDIDRARIAAAAAAERTKRDAQAVAQRVSQNLARLRNAALIRRPR